ncbi:hypothetical protein BOTBODRAFT_177776 [Botryobasidium botryosum FD-172 SS1]|uniref:Uncharacterized protein n=1 Tax=Botryobasidium botryosum (strain FD-172 SS1) TaxID=930990 RepID=A0A067MH73_BOTB1|nr:hypothetical protein BOTBODRAFT_177776 [Botryobasidium botryosum FD-172 SS1]
MGGGVSEGNRWRARKDGVGEPQPGCPFTRVQERALEVPPFLLGEQAGGLGHLTRGGLKSRGECDRDVSIANERTEALEGQEEDESLAARLVRLRKAAAERHMAYERFKADNGLGTLSILVLPVVPEAAVMIEEDVERASVEVEQVEVSMKAVEVEATEEAEMGMTAGDVEVSAEGIVMEAKAAEDATDIVVEAEMVEVETAAKIEVESDTVPQKRNGPLRKIAKVIGKQVRKLKLKVDLARLGAALKRI